MILYIIESYPNRIVGRNRREMGSKELVSNIFELAGKSENLEDFYGRSFALVLEEFNYQAGVLMVTEEDLFTLKVARGSSPGIWRMPPIDIRKSHLGELVQNQRPQIIDNPSSLEIGDYFNVFKSAALAPIIVRGYLLGVVVLFAKNKQNLADIDLGQLERISEAIGIVSSFFRAINFHAANQKQKEEIKALAEMLQNLSHSLDHQEMLTSLLAAAAKITKADMAALATYQKAKNALVVHPATHNIDEVKSAALKFGHDEKIGGATFCKGKIHVLNNLDDEHRSHFKDTDLKNVKSMIAIPLKTKSQSIGVMYLLSENENNFQNIYTEHGRSIDFSILERIASLISAGLSHSELARILTEEKEKLAQTEQSLVKEKEKSSLLSRLELGFSGLVGEQLKTPIAGIKEFLEMILAGNTGEIEKGTRQVIKEAKLATYRLANLVENIITSQELEKGNVVLRPKKTDLRLLIKEISDIYQKKIAEKGLRFVNNIKDPLWVTCDPNKTKQIISNLFDNAIKFTKNGQIKISARESGKFAEIKISDTGVGIPQEHLKNLFSKFFRSQTPQTQQIPGSGLGLWVTRGLVESQGGKISASSIKSQGSVFSFTLPRIT